MEETRGEKVHHKPATPICPSSSGEYLASFSASYVSLGPLLISFKKPGGRSSIGGLGGGYALNVETKYLRLSVRMNLQALVRGEGINEIEDQWPNISNNT